MNPMLGRFLQTGLIAGLLSFTSVYGQTADDPQEQGPPAQPTSSVLNRMRREPVMPSREQRIENAQQAGKIAPPQTPTQTTAPVQQAAAPAQQQTPQTYQLPVGAELRPANPPRISYTGGRLSIVADNSSLSDILNGIQTTTGTKLEGSQPDAERVFGQFGPGSPRQVLDALLAGSRYDFILLGSLEDPENVQRIVLSPHASSAGAGNGSAPGAQQAYRPPAPNVQNDDDDNDAFVNPQPTPVETPAPAPPQQAQQPGSPQVRTPEQLLQELQRMRQQQQQQQPQQQPR